MSQNLGVFMIFQKAYRCMLVLCLSTTMYAQALVTPAQNSLAGIDQKKVEKYQEKVLQEFKRNAQIRFAVAAVGLASVSFGVYILFFRSSKPSEVPLNIQKAPEGIGSNSVTNTELKRVIIELKRIIETTHNRVETVRNGMAKEGYDVGQEVDWSAWFKSWGRFLGKQSVSIVLGSLLSGMLNPFTKYFKALDSAVDNLIDRIFHEGDINWFLSAHTNFYGLLDQLEEHAVALSDSDEIDDQAKSKDKAYQCTLFINTWNLYIQQLVSMLGFMNYKAALLEKNSENNGQRAHAIIDEIMRTTNDAIKPMSKKLLSGEHVSKNGLAHINELVRNLRTGVGQAIENFAIAESVISY